MRAVVPMTWYPRSDLGLHSAYHGHGVYGAIYMADCPAGLGTLNTTSDRCPLRAVARVMEMALEGCRCAECRPVVEETKPLRLVGVDK